MRYRCDACGTGRWHAEGCANGVPGKMFDEAERDPRIAVETDRLLREAKAATAAPLTLAMLELATE